MLDMRKLSYFVSVAENLSFTKAATEHFIAQTAISQQIISLENQLGLRLFERNNRSVLLTPAGKVFLKDAKVLLSKSAEAIDRAQRAAKGIEGSISIGYNGPIERKFLPQLIRMYSNTYPAVGYSIVQDTVKNLKEGLNHGELDISFNIICDVIDSPALEWKKLHRYPYCAFMAKDHPLAREKSIDITRLAKEPIISLESFLLPGAYTALLQYYADHGFSPKIVRYAASLDTMFLFVEAGIGIAVLQNCFDFLASDNISMVTLENEFDSFDLVVAWRKDNPNPAVPLFIKMIEDHAEVLNLNLLAEKDSRKL